MGAFDLALITTWSSAADLVGLARTARDAVRPGGTVAFLGPTRRDGLRAIAGMLRRPRPVALEELCEALLIAELVDICARPAEGSGNDSFVFATAAA